MNRRPLTWVAVGILLAAVIVGCSGRRGPKRRQGSKGSARAAKLGPRIQVFTPPTLRPLIARLTAHLATQRTPLSLTPMKPPPKALMAPLEALLSGGAPVALIARQATPQERLRQHPAQGAGHPRNRRVSAKVPAVVLGGDTVAVITNATNPMDRLSNKDLRLALLGKVRNWRDIRGPNLPLVVYTLPYASGVSELLRRTLTDNRPFHISVRQVADTATLIESVRRTPGGLGLLALFQLQPLRVTTQLPAGVKPLALSTTLGRLGYLPTDRAAAAKGLYPLLLPVVLLMRPTSPNSARATQALKTLLSQAQSGRLGALLGLIKLPKTQHREVAEGWGAP